jgi:hypothetical protein
MGNTGTQDKPASYVLPSTNPLLNPSPTPTGPAAGSIPQPGQAYFISHSWGAGENLPLAVRARSSWISKLAGMIGLASDVDMINLSHPGQALAGTSGYVGSGWDAVNQWIVPPYQVLGYSDAGNPNPPYPTRSAALTCFLTGVNDPPQSASPSLNWVSAGGSGITMWRNALRSSISRCLAGAVYPAGDPTVGSLSGFTLNSNQNPGTGGQTLSATVANSSFVITLPQSWTGGTIALCFQSGPASAAPVYGVTLSGTVSSVVTPVAVDLSAVNNNILGIVANPASPVVKRLTTTAADAGNTITVTLNITSGAPTCTFDSWWKEADVQGLVLVANVPRYQYQESPGNFSFNDPQSVTPTQNAGTAATVAEFGANVMLVDIDSILAARSGTLTSAISSAVAATINVTTNGANFPWQPGFAIAVAQNTSSGSTGTENMWVTQVALASGGGQLTGPVPAGTALTLTVTRGANGSTALAAVSAGKWVADATWFQYVANNPATASAPWDNLHMNEVGYSQIANAFWVAWLNGQTALGGSPGASSFASVALKQRQNATMPGITSGALWYPPNAGALSTVQPANGVVQAIPFYTHQPVILTELGVEVVTGGSAGSVTRFGIAEQSDAFAVPNNGVLLDAGTVASVTSATSITKACWQRLLPGWYWLLLVTQGAPATTPVYRAIGDITTPLMSLSSTPLGAGVARPCGIQAFGTTNGALGNALVWTFANTPSGVSTMLTAAPRIFAQLQSAWTDNL